MSKSHVWIDADDLPLAVANRALKAELLYRRPCKGRQPRIEVFRDKWLGIPCWWCGAETCMGSTDSKHWGEVHHIAQGSIGRFDANWQFAWLCRRCHKDGTEEYNAAAMSDLSFGRLLRLKYHYDYDGTHWLPLVTTRGRRLPDLVDAVKFSDWQEVYRHAALAESQR